jgi:hypothetical protein
MGYMAMKSRMDMNNEMEEMLRVVLILNWPEVRKNMKNMATIAWTCT